MGFDLYSVVFRVYEGGKFVLCSTMFFVDCESLFLVYILGVVEVCCWWMW